MKMGNYARIRSLQELWLLRMSQLANICKSDVH